MTMAEKIFKTMIRTLFMGLAFFYIENIMSFVHTYGFDEVSSGYGWKFNWITIGGTISDCSFIIILFLITWALKLAVSKDRECK